MRRGLGALLFAVATGAGCGGGVDGTRPAGPLELFTAGALARSFRAAADSFAATSGWPAPLLEAAGSLETVRKLTELHRTPDLLALADGGLIDQLLIPEGAVDWYVLLASDRMVLAYSPLSRGAGRLEGGRWLDVVTGAGVLVGRSDPDRDPAGYRALLAMKLAERLYRRPGLAARLLEHAPPGAMRPKSADLVALVQAGELDYAWLYESVARTAGLQFVPLPPEMNLGDPDLAVVYDSVAVRVAGASPGDTLEIRGSPILFALTVPKAAPHPEAAVQFTTWLLGPEGRRVLSGAGLDLLPEPVVRGGPLPAGVASVLERRTVSAGNGSEEGT